MANPPCVHPLKDPEALNGTHFGNELPSTVVHTPGLWNIDATIGRRASTNTVKLTSQGGGELQNRRTDPVVEQ